MSSPGVADEMMAFPIRTAARVAGVSERRLKAWATRGLVSPSIDRRLRIYGFRDLVEVLVVRKLEGAGVHIRVIGSVVAFVRERGHHLPEVRFAVGDVARNEIYYQLPDGSWYDGKRPGQGVIPQTLALEALRVEVRRAARRRAGRPGEVEQRRGKLGGKLVFEGTRVPVETVQRYLRAGFPDERILASFPQLTPDDVAKARELSSAA